MQAVQVAEEERRLRHAALAEGLRALFALARNADEDARTTGWAGLPPDGAAQFVLGLHTLVADLHRGGRLERPWPEDDVVDVLVARVFPLLAPTSVARTPRGALATVERPEHVAEGERWERAAVSVLALLAKAVHPGAEVRGYLPAPDSSEAGRRVVVDVRFA